MTLLKSTSGYTERIEEMSVEQKKTCVFAHKVPDKKCKELQCAALKDYYCVGEDCKFWKSSDEWVLSNDGYGHIRVERKRYG